MHVTYIIAFFCLSAELLSIKHKFLNASVAGMASVENGGTPPAAPKSKKTAVEEIYQKKSQLEHILLRPDTYIGKKYPLKK